MPRKIDYYFSLLSPYSYLGHQRFLDLAGATGKTVNFLPVDFRVVFAATGGLPVAKRAPERQAYRLIELARWRDFLALPLNLKPDFWPTDDRLAVGMLMHVQDAGGDVGAFAGAVLRAVWAEQRNIADPGALASMAENLGMDAAALVDAGGRELYTRRWEENSKQAIAGGVFGIPTYVYADELFWGQDRLDFLERAIRAGEE